MYFKYCPRYEGKIAIRELKHVEIVPVYGSEGFQLVPGGETEVSIFADAVIGRLATLLCEPTDVSDRINMTETKGWRYGGTTVYNQICYDRESSAIAYFETIEEANTVMSEIASAIENDERIFDLTKWV